MDSFIGEIRAFGFNYAPAGWALCDGSALPVSQYQALYAVIGQTYGGNGSSTFNVPNLQGVAPMGAGAGIGLTPRVQGARAGHPNVALTQATTPSHNHTLQTHEVPAPFAGLQANPQSNAYIARLVQPLGANSFNTASAFSDTPAPDTQMSASALSPFPGPGAAHSNMQPYLTMNFCISLDGSFPTRP